MNPTSVALQPNPFVTGGAGYSGAGGSADFALHLRAFAPSGRNDDVNRTHTPAEPAKTDTTPAQSEDPEPGDSPHDGAEDPTNVAQQTINRAAGASSAAFVTKSKAGLIAGRARDVRDKTEREFLGRTDLAQLSAQELASRSQPQAVATPNPAKESPATSPSEERPPSSAGATSGPKADNRGVNSSPASDEPAPGAAESPESRQQTSENAGRQTSDHASHHADDAAPGPANSGEHSGAASSIPSAGGNNQNAIAGAAGGGGVGTKAQAAAPEASRDVAGVGAMRSPGQMLKRLERAATPAPVSKSGASPETEKPVPAAALRGLAAALRQGGGTVTLRLAPDALGSLKVQVSTQDAKIIAKFQTSTEQARRLLSENVETLRSAMESRGLSVDKIVVEHVAGWMPGGSGSSEQGHEQRTGGAGHQFAEAPPWNGSGPGADPGTGQDASHQQGRSHDADGTGQDGQHAVALGQGRPAGPSESPRGAGVEEQVAAAESAGATQSVAFTDEREPEQIIRLRVDAVA